MRSSDDELRALARSQEVLSVEISRLILGRIATQPFAGPPTLLCGREICSMPDTTH